MRFCINNFFNSVLMWVLNNISKWFIILSLLKKRFHVADSSQSVLTSFPTVNSKFIVYDEADKSENVALESWTLMKNNFYKRDMYAKSEWEKFKEDLSLAIDQHQVYNVKYHFRRNRKLNSLFQAINVFLKNFQDPYSRFFKAKSMSRKQHSIKGLSTGSGLVVRKKLNFSWLHSKQSNLMRTKTVRGCDKRGTNASEVLQSIAQSPIPELAVFASSVAVYAIKRSSSRVIPCTVLPITALLLSCSVLKRCGGVHSMYPVCVAEVNKQLQGSIRVGDQITGFNGRDVGLWSASAVNRALNEGPAGETFSLRVKRCGTDGEKLCTPIDSMNGAAVTAESPQTNPGISTISHKMRSFLRIPPKLKEFQPLSAECDGGNLCHAAPLSESFLYFTVNVTRGVAPLSSITSCFLLPTTIDPTVECSPSPLSFLRSVLSSSSSNSSSSSSSSRRNCSPISAYVCIREFTDETYREMVTALARLKQQSLQLHKRPLNTLYLDLRGNSGGTVVSALDIASLFLKKGTVLMQLSQGGQTHKPQSLNPSPDLTTSLCLLTDRKTASASEILVEALCDNGRAESAGSTTFGKNVAQAVVELSDGSGLCFTVSEFLSPRGRFMGGGHTPKTGTIPPFVEQELIDQLKSLK